MTFPETLVYNIRMSLRASIDIGSNTIRLLIGEVTNNTITVTYSDRRITRLGNGVGPAGMLQRENMGASLSVLREFASIISAYRVKQVRAVATSALREASNAAAFIKDVLDETGIAIEVISGEKEAELLLHGILFSLQNIDHKISSISLPFQKNGPGGMFIVDIGGGSTEWVLYRKSFPPRIGSIPVGVIKLTQRFIKSDPVSGNNITALHNEIESVVTKLASNIPDLTGRDIRLIGTAGTFTTLASLDLGLDTYSRDKVHLHEIPLKNLQSMSRQLLALPLEERKKVRGLEPERADLIIPGLQFTIKIMEFFHFPVLTVSDYGLLEGAILGIEEKDEKNISKTAQP
jgi:exopolyphosphatase / guanosine-5'-triphosphate,3'-diphosphate pyrophosphatase